MLCLITESYHLLAAKPSTSCITWVQTKALILFASISVLAAIWRTTFGLLQVFLLWPPTPQFEHFASFLSFWGRSPLCGQVVLLWPGSRNMLQKRVRLLVPHLSTSSADVRCFILLLFAPRSSYGGLSLLVVGQPDLRFGSGAFKPMKLSMPLPSASLAHPLEGACNAINS